MLIDALAVRLRPRTPFEAADLGVRLCQHNWRSVYLAWSLVAIPVMLLSLACLEISLSLPALLVWWAKPWLDRTVLFVLSRAAFGQSTTIADVWRAKRTIWGRRLWFSLTVRRLSPWRPLTEAVYQLEGLPLTRSAARVRQIRYRHAWSALMMTQTFVVTEAAVTLSVFSLAFWLAPGNEIPGLSVMIAGEVPPLIAIGVPLSYLAAVFFIEPFYVACGFAMYLNRRAELEAWDIEQELRRAFSR